MIRQPAIERVGSARRLACCSRADADSAKCRTTCSCCAVVVKPEGLDFIRLLAIDALMIRRRSSSPFHQSRRERLARRRRSLSPPQIANTILKRSCAHGLARAAHCFVGRPAEAQIIVAVVATVPRTLRVM